MGITPFCSPKKKYTYHKLFSSYDFSFSRNIQCFSHFQHYKKSLSIKVTIQSFNHLSLMNSHPILDDIHSRENSFSGCICHW